MLEVFKRHGIVFDHRRVIKKFFQTAARSRDTQFSPEMRALIDYGDWILPDGVETIRQINAWLSPDDAFDAYLVEIAQRTDSLLNAL
jgi:hypothetical protein